MREQNMKKEYPFEQTGQQNGSRRAGTDPRSLSELMNPKNINFFGSGLTDQFEY